MADLDTVVVTQVGRLARKNSHMRFLTVLLTVFLFSELGTASSQPLPLESLRFSEQRLARVTAHIDQRVREDKEAGLQLLIVHRGEQVLLHNAGLLYGNTPVADDAIFFTHSMMKPITSLAVMQLLERGKDAVV